MKANELMIGDWVAIGNNFIRVTSLQVSRNYPEVNPIPLTAEILEKNGWNNDALSTNFTLEGDNWSIKIEYLNEKWAIEIRNTLTKKDSYGRSDMVAFYRDWVKDIYVHELQHALRLCGIDKEIVL